MAIVHIARMWRSPETLFLSAHRPENKKIPLSKTVCSDRDEDSREIFKVFDELSVLGCAAADTAERPGEFRRNLIDGDDIAEATKGESSGHSRVPRDLKAMWARLDVGVALHQTACREAG
jgi:hypothetical protein